MMNLTLDMRTENLFCISFHLRVFTISVDASLQFFVFIKFGAVKHDKI